MQQTFPGDLSTTQSSTELLTTQCGSTVVRCLPTSDRKGFGEVPELGPATPGKPKIDEDLLLAYGGQGSGASGATQPPQQGKRPNSSQGPSKSGAMGADRDKLAAYWYPTMPTGSAAHNAAHCEYIPGDLDAEADMRSASVEELGSKS